MDKKNQHSWNPEKPAFTTFGGKQLVSEHWEQPLIRASRARNVDSAERRHGQHEPKPGHVQKSSAGGRVATVGVYFFFV